MIQYKNIWNEPVTPQQFNLLEEYIIETIDDTSGDLKIVESVRKGRNSLSRRYYYYLDASEDKNSVIQNLMTKELVKNIYIFCNKSSAFGYVGYDVESYRVDNGALVSRAKNVYDNQNKLIMRCTIDLTTNLIENHPANFPVKYYYDNIYPGIVFEFRYRFNETTQVYEIEVNDQSEDSIYINSLDLSKFIASFGQDFWDTHPYYHAIYPLMPTSANL